MVERKGVRENVFQMDQEGSHGWDWRGVPAKWPLVKLWDAISLAWMLYASLRTICAGAFLSWLERHLIRPSLGVPAHCLLMGRIVFHPSVDHVASMVLSCSHIFWRTLQRFSGRRYMLGPLTFLLQSERDIDAFLRLVAANKGGAYLSDWSEPPPVESRHVLAGFAPTSSGRRQFTNLSARFSSARNSDSLTGNQSQLEEVSAHEHLLRHVMCYEVYSARGLQYKLRPNRTLEARRELASHLSNSSFFSAICLLVLTTPIATLIVLILLSDFHYAQIYSGCHAPLDRLLAAGQLGFWSRTLTRHRVAAFVLDLWENVVIWVNSGAAATFVLALTYFLNCDLLLYWRHLHRRLEAATGRAKDHFALTERLHGTGAPSGGGPLERRLHAEAARLSALINQLQCEINDFFLEVERADLIVSDILTAAILIWLSSCAILGYFYLTSFKSGTPAIIKLVQFFGLSVITLASKYLLRLHHCCLRSYRLICTLMAYEQSHQTKWQFIRLLEFYSKRASTSYTLLHYYPYVGTTYIALIGWSLSCLAIVYALFGREQLIGKPETLVTRRYFDF